MGVTIPAKSKKSLTSPKISKQKTKIMKKRTTVQNSNIDMMNQAGMMKQFCCQEAILEPVFRYIPDRRTIQRLIMRAANMKDDLAEFGLNYDEPVA